MIVLFFILFWLLGVCFGGVLTLYGLTVCKHETFMATVECIMEERLNRHKTEK